MQFVNVRELHIDTTKVLSRISKGEKIIVTNRGKPQALITPITQETLSAIIIVSEPLLASESSLQKDWLKPQEDEAWQAL